MCPVLKHRHFTKRMNERMLVGVFVMQSLVRIHMKLPACAYRVLKLCVTYVHKRCICTFAQQISTFLLEYVYSYIYILL